MERVTRMPWARIDDGYLDNGKVMEISNDAVVLHLGCILHSAKKLTDGFISETVLQRLRGARGIPTEAVEELLRVGLLEHTEGGYRVHDYLEYQPSREQVMKQREEAAKRQAEWRARHTNEKRNAVTNAVTNTNSVTPLLTADPISHDPCLSTPDRLPEERSNDPQMKLSPPAAAAPEPEQASQARRRRRNEAYSAEFEAFWQAYPNRIEKKQAWQEWQKVLRSGVAAVALIQAARHYATFKAGEEQFAKYPQRFLSHGTYEDFMNGPPPRARAPNGKSPPRRAVDRESIAPHVSYAELYRKQEANERDRDENGLLGSPTRDPTP